jgi:hypothetical protein
MKSPRSPLLGLIIFSFLSSHLAFAQPADQKNSHQQARDDARILFIDGSDDAAEQKLVEANRNPPGTPEWHLESANVLVHMAFSFARDSQPEKAALIARRALRHTEQVATNQGLSALRSATADEMTAFIQEKLLADYAAAKAAYQSAAQRNPTGGAAKQVERLDRMNQEGNRKGGTPNG